MGGAAVFSLFEQTRHPECIGDRAVAETAHLSGDRFRPEGLAEARHRSGDIAIVPIQL